MQNTWNVILRVFVLWLACSSSAHAAGPAPGQWSESSETYGLFNLHLYMPQNAKTKLAGKRALMVVLHGCKQTVAGDIIDKRIGWEAVAEQYGMLVAAPDVPETNPMGTRVAPGCWDWFGTAHKRGERDAGLLAGMINGLQARPELKIDARQIYVVGLSSGAGVAHVFACSYPELVAGVGVHSGPTLGTALMDVLGPPKLSAEESAGLCGQYAADQKPAFATQIASFIHGGADRLVHPVQALRNSEAMQVLYSAAVEAGKIEETNQSKGTLYKDGKGKVRVAHIEVEGLGHAFSAGSGGSGGGTHGSIFHDYSHINYPAWVTRFFFDHNLRVKR